MKNPAIDEILEVSRRRFENIILCNLLRMTRNVFIWVHACILNIWNVFYECIQSERTQTPKKRIERLSNTPNLGICSRSVIFPLKLILMTICPQGNFQHIEIGIHSAHVWSAFWHVQNKTLYIEYNDRLNRQFLTLNISMELILEYE